MKRKPVIRMSLAVLAIGAAAAHAQSMKVVSETTVGGFPFPESSCG